MNMLFYLFICLSLCSFAQSEESMNLNSTLAQYDGKEIILKGGVSVEHSLGTITAEYVKMTPEALDKKVQFEEILMEDQVHIALRDGGSLSCAIAEINLRTQTGNFRGAKHGLVSYMENCHEKSGKTTPLTLQSCQMQVQLAKSDKNSLQSPHKYISTIEADKQVTVHYNQDFLITADHATYHRHADDFDGDKQMLPGRIVLKRVEEYGFCQVINNRQDIIKSQSICIDTVKRQLFFEFPIGAVRLTHAKEGIAAISFSSNSLTWDDPQHTLSFNGNVVINQQGIGTIETDEEFKVIQGLSNGETQLRRMESSGHILLTYRDNDQKISHVLTCHGTVLVDHGNLTTTMESYCNGGEQVLYHDEMGKISGDKLIVFYTMMEGNPRPCKLVLEGNVKVRNQPMLDGTSEPSSVQCAIADKIEYTPQAQEIYLSAKGKRRVLFFDKTNNLEVSAPAIKIKRDQATSKDSIQGIGNVRFRFVEKELDLMKGYFHDILHKEPLAKE